MDSPIPKAATILPLMHTGKITKERRSHGCEVRDT